MGFGTAIPSASFEVWRWLFDFNLDWRRSSPLWYFFSFCLVIGGPAQRVTPAPSTS